MRCKHSVWRVFPTNRGDAAWIWRKVDGRSLPRIDIFFLLLYTLDSMRRIGGIELWFFLLSSFGWEQHSCSMFIAAFDVDPYAPSKKKLSYACISRDICRCKVEWWLLLHHPNNSHAFESYTVATNINADTQHRRCQWNSFFIHRTIFGIRCAEKLSQMNAAAAALCILEQLCLRSYDIDVWSDQSALTQRSLSKTFTHIRLGMHYMYLV